MHTLLLIAQIPPTLTDATQNWTILGLLAMVLAGVGYFLRSYIPTMQENFHQQLNNERTTWVAMIEKDRTFSENRLNTLVETFNSAINRLDTNDREMSQAIRDLEAHLKDRK